MNTKDFRFDDLSSVKKHIEMVVMKPRQGRITLIGRRLYYLLLGFAQTKMQGAPMLSNELFKAPLRDLLRVGDSEGEEITVAKEYLKEMLDFKVDWESADQGDGVKWTGISMLSEVSLEVINGQNWVSWAFPPTIVKMILLPDRYSKLNLKIITSISSYHGTALYDICSRYRDNPSGVTSRKSVDWWIYALNRTAPDNNKREWRKFKFEKILGAIEEINNDTDITIELIEFKSGRTITEAQFSVKKKMVERPIDHGKPVEIKKLTEIENQANNLGINVNRIESLLCKFGQSLLKEKLDQLEARIADQSKVKIENNYAYLKTILTNNSFEDVKIEKNIPTNIAEIIGSTTKSKLPELKNALPDSAIVNKQISNVRDEINALTNEERVVWIERGLQSLRLKKLCTARDITQAEAGKVFPGLLGSEIIRLYQER